MKTERRHELQTNTLAVSLAHWIDAAKPYARAGIALVLILIVCGLAWGYLASQSQRQSGDSWTAFFAAFGTRNDPREALTDVTQRFSGTPAANWALTALADFELDSGTKRLFVGKPEALDELRQAADHYQTVLHETEDRLLLERATFGLARTHETLNKLEMARNEYRDLAKRWPDSPYAKNAEARAADLDLADTKAFYDWFAQYEPPKPLAGERGKPGQRPDFMKEPPEGGLELPSLFDGKPVPKPQGDAAIQVDAAGGGETPAADAEPSAGEAKPEAAPDSAPTEPEKPAETPAPAPQ